MHENEVFMHENKNFMHEVPMSRFFQARNYWKSRMKEVENIINITIASDL